MRYCVRLPMFLSLTLSLILLSGTAFAQQLPPLFEGELNVCNTVERSRAEGQTLREALVSFIQSYRSNNPELLSSIRRTIIHNAILICQYDAGTVIQAGALARLPIELVVGAALGAGVDEPVITAALLDLGVDSDTVAVVMDQMKAPLVVDLFLPPPFEAVGGLGQASPFTP